MTTKREPRDRWPGRLAALAAHIPPGSRVLDAGCGAQGLQVLLPPGCSYVGVDVEDLDLDRQAWPRGFDVVVAAGLLEYLAHPYHALRQMLKAAPVSLFSYAHKLRTVPDRPVHLEPRRLHRLVSHAGGRLEPLGRWQKQTLYRMVR